MSLEFTKACLALVRASQLLAQLLDPFRNLEHDTKEAREHAIQFDENFDDYEFKTTKILKFPLSKLKEYDDIGPWLEFLPGELAAMSDADRKDALVRFRGLKWAEAAQQWLQDGIPAIVIVSTPEFTGVADGRGRVNLAIGMGLKTIPTAMLESNRLPHQKTYNVGPKNV